MRRVQASFLGIACIAALCGCSRNKHVDRDGYSDPSFDKRDDSVGTTTLTGADIGSLSNGLAIERIVAARCSRETACNNIGGDKRYANYELCTNELRSKMGKELEPNECLRGMDEAALDKCLDSIRTESCSNPIDTIQRLATCRMNAMCEKSDERKR